MHGPQQGNPRITPEISLFGDSSLKSKAIIVGAMAWLGIVFALYSDYNLATGTGNLSTLLFIAANTYYPAKRIRLHYDVRHVQAFFNKFLVLHIWLNTAAFAVACIHCYITLWSNHWLMIALFLMGWLTFGGFLMWIKYPPAKVRKGMYLLHTQQTVFFLMILAILKGHYVI
jgi:hypothetical protein